MVGSEPIGLFLLGSEIPGTKVCQDAYKDSQKPGQGWS